MAFEITPNVKVRRDDKGRARQLSHPQQPFTRVAAGFEAAPSPRALAEQYLREIAPVLELPDEALANFAAELERTAPQSGGSELRFREEKTAADMAAVTFAQTRFGIPVWNAGVTVRVRTAPNAVLGAQNEFHYDLDVDRPPPSAPYLPDKVNEENLSALFTRKPLPNKPRINTTQLWIFQYEPDARSERPPKEKSFEAPAPTLELPPMPASIWPGKHYVVTEVLFTMEYPDWGKLNWRAMVEVETRAILYLRALVACATGRVFESDPATLAGSSISAHSPVATLDAVATKVNLNVDGPPSPTQRQKLKGPRVELVDSQAPLAAPPTEPEPFEFHYSANTTNFAAVSAYHHCDAVFRWIEDMGFPLSNYFDGTTFPVPVDHHGKFGQVNADAPGNATGDGSGGFRFGIAEPNTGVGIAADVRVVLHEFGHAILWDHVRSPNFGFAHSPGDSLAAILHAPASKATDPFATFPFMTASVGIDRRHDRLVTSGWAWGGSEDDTQYGSEQILSTTLFRVYRACGGDHSDLGVRQVTSRYVAYLIVKGVGLLSFTTPDPEVYADALMESDLSTVAFRGLPGGAFHKVIRWSFEQQGLYQAPGTPTPITGPGLPPEIDVFVDDGRGGDYMPYLEDFAHTEDVWNRRFPDGLTEHQDPSPGSANFLYVRIKNRGTDRATSLALRGYQSTQSGLADWPAAWQPLTSVWTSGGPLASGASVIAGPVQWTPLHAKPEVLVSVGAVGDESNADRIQSPIPLRWLVPTDNNIAVRAMATS